MADSLTMPRLSPPAVVVTHHPTIVCTMIEAECRFSGLKIAPDMLHKPNPLMSLKSSNKFKDVTYLGISKIEDNYCDCRDSGPPGKGFLVTNGVFLRHRSKFNRHTSKGGSSWEVKAKNGATYEKIYRSPELPHDKEGPKDVIFEGQKLIENHPLRPVLGGGVTEFLRELTLNPKVYHDPETKPPPSPDNKVLGRYFLEVIAHIVTKRTQWLLQNLDGTEFYLSLDLSQFGHIVCKARMKETLQWPEGHPEEEVEKLKAKAKERLMKTVVKTVRENDWLFKQGEPKSKLDAFLEWKAKQPKESGPAPSKIEAYLQSNAPFSF